MKLAGMKVVVEELPMTKEQHQYCISALADRVAEKYFEKINELAKQRKEKEL